LTLYNANGNINTTVVNGSVYTGVQANDGSWNIVINDGSSLNGLYHPCGAYNAVIVTDKNSPSRALNGSLNVIDTGGGVYSPTPLLGTGSVTPGITNLVTNSQAFNNWTPLAVTVTSNVANDPVNSLNVAARLAETSTTSQHNITSANISFTATQAYTFSVYGKYETAPFIQLLFGSAPFGANAWANFDLQNGVVGTVDISATASIQNKGNGWYRCIVTSTATATAGGPVAIFCANSASMTRALGYAGVASNTKLIADAQVETGSTANTYVPT
jgi:hypothetical protein